MAKSLDALVNNLLNLGKEASASPESQVDPACKGEANIEVPKDRTIAPLPGQSASLDVPAVTPTEPAGDQKVEGGESVGSPATGQFVESVTPGSAKNAGFLASCGDLRSKLASFGKEVQQTPPAPAPAPAAQTPAAPAPAKEASEYVPGDYLLKVASYMMQSARGLSAINEAITEVLGKEEGDALLKKAADENVTFMRNYTIERLRQVEAEELRMKQAAEAREAQAYYAELTKGASAEEIEKIDNSALLIKRAAALFEDNDAASYAVNAGFLAAQKVAAAIEQGAAPEEAAMAAAAPAEGPPSPEELEAALSALVQQGVIKPEEAEQLLAQLVGGGAAPAEGAPPEEAAKAASADAALDKIASVIFPA